MRGNIVKIFLIIFFTAFVAWPNFAQADETVTVYLFYGEGCPHCAEEEAFLDNLENEIAGLIVERFEVWNNPDNAKLMAEVGEKFQATIPGVPFTVIGDQYMPGYYDDSTSGEAVRNKVQECLADTCPDLVGEILGKVPSSDSDIEGRAETEDNISDNALETINVPFFGEIKTKDFSLPLLTIIIGALDGFNPCAMWVLLFLISMLINMKNRRRMWILGSAFIIASAAVYFVFLAAWLNIFLFLGMARWLQVAIALVALYTGYHHLRQYWKNRKGLVCDVTGAEKRQRTFSKLKSVIEKKSFWLALGGIIALAAVVNMVELLCSAGLPAVYTSVISAANLSTIEYYGYLLLYILVFMLDDLIIFFIAMITLKATGISDGKYSKYSSLIGGIIMILIGILFILKPGWLMFG